MSHVWGGHTKIMCRIGRRMGLHNFGGEMHDHSEKMNWLKKFQFYIFWPWIQWKIQQIPLSPNFGILLPNSAFFLSFKLYFVKILWRIWFSVILSPNPNIVFTKRLFFTEMLCRVHFLDMKFWEGDGFWNLYSYLPLPPTLSLHNKSSGYSLARRTALLIVIQGYYPTGKTLKIWKMKKKILLSQEK